MSEHLPVLLVVVPMILAPLAALMGRWKVAWGVAAVACWWAFGASIALLSASRRAFRQQAEKVPGVRASSP